MWIWVAKYTNIELLSSMEKDKEVIYNVKRAEIPIG